MTRVIPKRRKWKADEVVVAWTTFAAEDYTILRGTRVRGDSPAAQAHPHNFVADGTPESEWPKLWDSVPEPTVEEPSFTRRPPPILDEEAAVAIQDLTVRGRHIPRGMRLRRDDPVVQANKDLFRTPAMRLT